jgi:hypothetical protein
MPNPTSGSVELTDETPCVSTGSRKQLSDDLLESGQGTKGVAATNPPMEGPVHEDEKKKKPAYRAELPLKRGAGRIEMRDAQGWERELRDLLEHHPEHFKALRALVEGRPEEVTKEQRRLLRKWDLLGRNLAPLPDVQAVMMAAVRDTPDGTALVFPLDLASPVDAATHEQGKDELDKGVDARMQRVTRDMFRDDEDHGKGRPR